jgi:hypothetical protein
LALIELSRYILELPKTVAALCFDTALDYIGVFEGTLHNLFIVSISLHELLCFLW